MKLYREVPPEKGTGLSLHVLNGDWAEPTYKASLEPYELPTEEEMRKEAIRIAETYGGGLYGDYRKAAYLGIKAITNLLER